MVFEKEREQQYRSYANVLVRADIIMWVEYEKIIRTIEEMVKEG